MANIKQGKTSNIILKTNTAENWEKCESKYIPVNGIILVYQFKDGTSKIKISDGVTLLKDLPFIQQNTNKESTPSIDGDTLTWE